MRNVAVVGAGVFPFGRHSDLLFQEMGRPAVIDAIQDAGIDSKEVDACYIGTTGAVGMGHEILYELDMLGMPITRVENACVSGSNAIRDAWMSIAGGLHDIVLVVGIEKMKDSSMAVVSGGQTRFQLEMKALPKFPFASSLGMVGPPGYFALAAHRHMAEFGTTQEHLAEVVVKSRRNAQKNPKAEYRIPMTVEEVLNDKMINPPLTRAQCCPKTDGAAAVILMSEDLAKKHADTPAWVKSSAMGSSFTTELLSDLTTMPNTEVAEKAFKMAKLEARDFFKRGFAEVHDCFSISELLHYEDLGWCMKGDAPKMLEEGITEIDGDLPINPSGGLLSCGHPLGATGVRQVAEVLYQMRKDKEVAKRQIPDRNLNIALTHTMGQPGLGWTGSILIFSRNIKISG
ncbi:MAG: thiolase family protein [Candidatus Helarchaeota archaeon]|nr:thiolase family protein [Candidatus Helarchaeota archaeon]